MKRVMEGGSEERANERREKGREGVRV